jgi:hypothetical protein
VSALSENASVPVALAVLGLLFAGFLVYRTSRRRKKKPSAHKG